MYITATTLDDLMRRVLGKLVKSDAQRNQGFPRRDERAEERAAQANEPQGAPLATPSGGARYLAH